VNELYEAWKSIAIILLGILMAIVGWFGKRNAEHIDELRQNAITRKELTEALDRIEVRQRVHHGENRDLLERIVTKIDANEERAAKTRHDTKDEVHTLAMQVAVLAKNNRTHDR
jgi:hypothetical protein